MKAPEESRAASNVGAADPSESEDLQLSNRFWIATSVLAAAVLLPFWLGQFGEFVIAIGFIYVLVAISLHLLVHWAGQISFAHVAFVGLGAHVTARLATGGYPVWLSLSAGIASCLVISLAFGIPALRIRGFYLAILTFAFGYAADRWLFRQTWLSGTFLVGNTVPRPRLFGVTFSDGHMYLLILTWLVVVIIGLSRLRKTKGGRAFMALRHSEDLAASFGINVAYHKIGAFMASSAIAGLGGGLWAYTLTTVDQTTFPVGLSLIFITLVVVGGPGPIWGTAVFAFAFGIVPPLIGGDLARWMGLIGPVSLLIVILLYPGGQNQAFRDTGRLLESLVRRIRGELSSGSELSREVRASGASGSLFTASRAEPSEKFSGRSPVLEVSEVSVSFGGLQALDAVSLTARRGLVTGLIGPNGAGKSTLLNCVSGLLLPESGTVHVFGEDVSSMPPHRRAQSGIGRTFQYMALCPDETVMENLLIAQHRNVEYGVLSGVLGGSRVSPVELGLKDKADEMLELFELGSYAFQPARGLSLGTAKRLELACVLACNPPLMLLDEPTGGLDEKETRRLVRILETVREGRDLTILLVTHNMRLVMGMASHIYVLNFGRTLAEGSPSEIRRNASVIDAYLGAEAVDG